MFERFTEEARLVVVVAQEESRTHGHDHIATEHLVLALVRDKTVAGRALASLGVTIESARELVVARLGRHDETPTGQIPFTPHAKMTLEGALRETLNRGDSAITPGHLLLSLMRYCPEGGGTAVLKQAGATPDVVRGTLESLMGARSASSDRRAAFVPSYEIAPDEEAGRLLRLAAALALAAGRDEYGVQDVRDALDELRG